MGTSAAASALARLLRAGLIRRGRLGAAPQPPTPDEPAPAQSRYRPAEPPLEELVEGRWVALGEQRCYVTDQLYPWSGRHGDALLDSFLQIPDAQWTPFACRDTDQPFVLRRAALLDIETTGLERGAGTYAFLVGLGLPEEDGLRVRQLFMPDFGDEEALLDLLSADLERFDGLVTFNGRSFDWPILRTRFIMARRPPPLSEDAPHLDLLLLARRLWRRRLTSCALSSLETAVLGLQRSDDDVPGWMIPQLYLDYVQLRRTRPMVGVFYHNAMDVVAMAALAGRIGRLLTEPTHAEATAYCDFIALGQLYERDGRHVEALDAYRSAIGAAPDADEIALANRYRAALLKRLGHLEEACRLWKAQVPGNDIYPYIELAKYHEHQERDYCTARQRVLEALTWLDQRKTLLDPAQAQRQQDELAHRLARLERRLANQSAQANPQKRYER